MQDVESHQSTAKKEIHPFQQPVYRRHGATTNDANTKTLQPLFPHDRSHLSGHLAPQTATTLCHLPMFALSAQDENRGPLTQ